MKSLQGQETLLAYEVGNLGKEKEELEAAIRTNKGLLQETVAQKLMILKIQRPDLFTISGQEQIARLVGMFLKNILT